jgi:hypothetical protein
MTGGLIYTMSKNILNLRAGALTRLKLRLGALRCLSPASTLGAGMVWVSGIPRRSWNDA